LNPTADWTRLSLSLLQLSCPEVAMPVYDYVCNDCHKSFELVLTLSEHDKDKIVCPKCGSKNVAQEMAEFFAVTSKKS